LAGHIELLLNFFLSVSYVAFVHYFQIQFLSLKGPDKVDPVEHMEKFWYWLKDQGISAHRSAVVRAIAEKMNSMMNGLYDAEAYGDDDDDDDEEE